MKAYILIETPEAGPSCIVQEGSRRGPNEPIFYRLPYVPRPVPPAEEEGFSWGSHSTTAQNLAHSIVAHFLGHEVPSANLWRAVCFELIAGLPERGGVLTHDQIRTVLQGAIR